MEETEKDDAKEKAEFSVILELHRFSEIGDIEAVSRTLQENENIVNGVPEDSWVRKLFYCSNHACTVTVDFHILLFNRTDVLPYITPALMVT